ncbi:MAG: VCBS repeat-containing protein [Desulfobacteraceae bacterium]|nr:VCBS repeat-containing protein [Desulfobacteraceae bacterium]
MKNFNCLKKNLVLKCSLLILLALCTLFTQDARCASFIDSGQTLGDSNSNAVALGDIDGDNDLDAFVANAEANKIWINQGGNQGGNPGKFLLGQTLEGADSNDVALGDIDGDNDLDAFVAIFGRKNEVWINQGGEQNGTPGVFKIDQSIGSLYSTGVALGDVDGDNKPDAFVANIYFQTVKLVDTVWINNGNGEFSIGKFLEDDSYSWSVALGYFDGDGYLDAFVANEGANIVWINDGKGDFPEDRKKILSDSVVSKGVAIADLDGDNDFDAFVANYGHLNKVWLNQGGTQSGIQGVFLDSGQKLGTEEESATECVFLEDIDNDGDIDAFEANSSYSNIIWVNDGNGNFTEFQKLGASEASYGVALGDLDGDDDIDAFVANGSYQPNKVWLNTLNSPAVNLPDAILALKIVAGFSPENINMGADINKDSKIGLEEAIYILQVISELR